MMVEKKPVRIIICVDRDNDFGRKAGVEGPIIGRKANSEAANKLLLADPTESDANCLFAALKMYDELRDKTEGIEIVTVTGYGKAGFKSDQLINEQLDFLEEKYNIDGFILITDGAEDDQIIPVLQSRAKIISKQVVLVKQAQPVESMYYTIKEALADPYIARIVFAVPGTIILFYALTLIFQLQELFVQGVSFIIGLYFIMRGLGFEFKLNRLYKNAISAFSPQRASFPFYIGAVFIFIFGIYTFYQNITGIGEAGVELVVSAMHSTYLFMALMLLSIAFARALDHIHTKKAYLLGRDFLFAVSVIAAWIIVDSATLVFLREENLNFFLFSMLVSFVLILAAFRISDAMNISKKASDLMLDLPVYDKAGRWLGRVTGVDKRSNSVIFSRNKEINKTDKFRLVNGRIFITRSN